MSPSKLGQSMGGIARGIIERKASLDSYYLNPNKCKLCEKIIDVKPDHKVSETKKQKFCSRSCGAIYNNSKKPKKIKIVKVPVQSRLIDISLPIRSFLYKKGSSMVSRINDHARKVIEQTNLPKSCTVCGYTSHVEVHHKIPIRCFDLDTPLEVVNSIYNLVYLCPNHHWEVEHYLINIH